MTAPGNEPTDLVEPEGVNAGSALGERDRRPDGEAAASSAAATVPAPQPRADELVGLPGQAPNEPGQQLEAGEG